MFKAIQMITGKEKGPTSIVLAGVHGNERCGVQAFKKILPRLKIERGRVFFGYGNPKAIQKNRRFVESNLNRLFRAKGLSKTEKKSYEYRRAQFLKKYLNQADALLDIHASSVPGKPFLIYEKNAKGIREYLPAKLVVSGFDTVEPGGTDYYMNSIGKIGICLEAGHRDDPKAVAVAIQGIYAFLKSRGHITNNLRPRKQSEIRMYENYYAKSNAFTLLKKFRNFETVSKRQLIGIDGIKKVRAPRKSFILFASNGKRVGDEVFLLGN